MRGGNPTRDLYLGAYSANLGVDAAGDIVLRSYTGAEPLCGDGTHEVIAFTSGSAKPTEGEVVTGDTSGHTATVVAWYKSAGDWAAGTAVGNIYIRQPSNDEGFQAENLSGATSGNNFMTAEGAAVNLDPTLQNFRTYGETRWGAANGGVLTPWTYILQNILMYIEFGTLDLQTALGKGVCDLESGVGYAGLLNGALSADSNIGTNGTGSGTGINGNTPVVYRGIELPYSGRWLWLDGEELTEDEVRIIRPDGLGTLRSPLQAGDYVATTFAPTQEDGWIGSVEAQDLYGLMLLYPCAPSGTYDSLTGMCDYHHGFDPGTTKSSLVGGSWNTGTSAGPAYRYAQRAASHSSRNFGVRIEVRQ